MLVKEGGRLEPPPLRSGVLAGLMPGSGRLRYPPAWGLRPQTPAGSAITSLQPQPKLMAASCEGVYDGPYRKNLIRKYKR